jgi:YHS domain-containing protein
MKKIRFLGALAALVTTAASLAPAAETKAKAYPLDTCLVSGEKLGSMGKPVVIEDEGQQIAFCCKSCRPKFEKDPAKYLQKLPQKDS